MLLPLLVAATISVAATTTDLRDLVVAVGGDRVRVASLTDARQDPHTLEILPRQLARLREASLLVRIGLDHEPWLARALGRVDARPRDLDASRELALLGTETPRLRTDGAAHVHAFGNTHYWLDPLNARTITQRILDALAALAPDDRPAFVEHRARFLARLDAALPRWEAALRPFAGARVVTAHDTWPYFARRFGLDIVATVEPTPGVPPSASYLAELTRRMQEAQIKIVVAEPYSNFSLVNQVAARGGARAVTLIPSVGGDPEAGDYLSLFDVDIKRFTAAAAR